MDDDAEILRLSRELSLDLLGRIGAKVEESDRLYYVEIPKQFEQAFGGAFKRITFDHDVADAHSCELAVPGSNFLAAVLGEARKAAPVVAGSLKKHAEGPAHMLGSVATHNCEASLLDSKDDARTAIRFHFNVGIKSVKRVAMLRWVDVDLGTLDILEFPSDIQMDDSDANSTLQKDDPRIEDSYSRAAEFLGREMGPLAQKYVGLTADNQSRDIDSIKDAYERRVAEIVSDLKLQESKLADFDAKIARARTVQSMENHMQQKDRQLDRLEKDEENAARQIERLASDRDAQIEQIRKRYRPAVEFSLIAAQVYSYSSSQCLLEFKGGASSRQVEATFMDPARAFVVMCDACGNQLDVAHLCVNSHLACGPCSRHCAGCQKDVCVSCESELSPCYICREGLCPDCIARCDICLGAACAAHISGCPHCSKKLCYFCSDSCQICHARFCEASIRACHKCKRRLCGQDSARCAECGMLFCPGDIGTCAICGKKSCPADMKRCKFCEQEYGASCLDGKLCATCKELRPLDRDAPEVLAVIRANPDLAKFKKWRGSANGRFSIFRAKKMLGSRIVIYDKTLGRIVLDKKGGWI